MSRTRLSKTSSAASGNFAWKWNQFNLPLFYWNSWQQDYALPGLTNLAWLQEGMAIDINNPSQPKPYSLGGSRQEHAASDGDLHFQFLSFVLPSAGQSLYPNNVLYYGTWGAAQAGNATWGNNPQSGQVVTNPLASGAPMPSNPILQIKDANGNLLVLTGYGTLGTTAPVAPAASLAGVTATPGTGDTTTWTVVDPYGQGIRLTQSTESNRNRVADEPCGTDEAYDFRGNASSLSAQNLFPLTDEFYQ